MYVLNHWEPPANTRKSVENVKSFNVNSYKLKKEPAYPGEVSKSIDWSSHLNPMIREEKKRPEFIKIDYLRFDKKSDQIRLKDSSTVLNLTN